MLSALGLAAPRAASAISPTLSFQSAGQVGSTLDVEVWVAGLGDHVAPSLRAFDIANPYQPKEIATFVPPAPPGAPTGTIQMNDVFIDEREVVYCVDRHVGGLYCLEMDF